MKTKFSILLLPLAIISLTQSIKIRTDTVFTQSGNITLDTGFRVVKKIDRSNARYFVEGLTFLPGNKLIESTGLFEQSELHTISLDYDQFIIEKRSKLNDKFFGEGCAVIHSGQGNNLIYQLTWQNRKVFVYDTLTLEKVKEFDMPEEIQEGWGMASQYHAASGKEKLYVSDGTQNIYIVNPDSFTIEDSYTVHQESGRELNFINELEMVEGKLWANVYDRFYILIINPEDGLIERAIDFTSLFEETHTYSQQKGIQLQYNDVFNGIAYNPNTKQLLLTGKNWPLMWEVEVEGIHY